MKLSSSPLKPVMHHHLLWQWVPQVNCVLRKLPFFLLTCMSNGICLNNFNVFVCAVKHSFLYCADLWHQVGTGSRVSLDRRNYSKLCICNTHTRGKIWKDNGTSFISETRSGNLDLWNQLEEEDFETFAACTFLNCYFLKKHYNV